MLMMIVLAAIFVTYVEKDSLREIKFRGPGFYFAVFMGLGLGVLGSAILGDLFSKKSLTELNTSKLGSFQNASTKNSKTYLATNYDPGGFGHAADRKYFYYLESDETHMVKTISGDEVLKVVYFKGGSQVPEVKTYVRECKNPWLSWRVTFVGRKLKYEFTIPEGSLLVQ